MADPEAATASPPAAGAGTPSPPSRPGPLRRLRRLVRRPQTRSGLFALLLVVAGLGGAAAFTGGALVRWTETADFCGRCHQMGPELAAYEAGPHSEVACAECHVEPGVLGWIEAKVNGTRQLAQVVLGIYPRPVPPPDHDNLPSPSDTCIRCHTVERFALAQLKTRTQYTEDEANTRQFVGLMIRPGGGDVFDVSRSVHWHVLADVEYVAPDAAAQTIDWVRVTANDGSVREFIAQDRVRVSGDVQPDVEAVLAEGTEHRMNCIDCHNRAGHPIPNPRQVVDRDLSEGVLDPGLPYLKREAMRLLWAGFPDEATADREIERLRDFYTLKYPLVAERDAAAINQAIGRLKVLYRSAATPEMQVTARTYPDNLGHTDFPGCFRCHDGGHFLIEDGALTSETIPSTCDTCHTFPQIGQAVASLPLGKPPATHDDALFVFNHRDVATDVDPGVQSCGECHARDYCANCHDTGAVTVDHDLMLTNHAEVIRTTGNEACAYCHQPVYCARCHSEPVLPGSQPLAGGTTGALPGDPASGGAGATASTRPPGLSWPLLTVAPQLVSRSITP
jgi:nitrate/TMAO reductase-like tetraheme cytochrome c subunit